ncbi:hypothetical protein MQ089_10680 [Edwardsiella anguillarum]|uniref:hypothetical protein n=1 Tax=Edwardsiella anguillarum TaxID=1821960 RepID=UPI0024B83D19|nr:hypothetical protein [Edwardsiella anguillarum]WHQ16389.1 hypothetical protein MQ085_10690 [Edwardsiella anguillarum]WHQ19922.1 hypothetical protein MQ089_10680 [Edwardsiella anguillarum]WHQ23444.1 hypothetical protein MQ094_10695 [Edwardsiella anguillarum]WHQ27017.1 hypothetical protein MQ093_10910 [Edwardsiella anguillarum]
MSWPQFIHDNIRRQLVGEGFAEALARKGAEAGVAHYVAHATQASRCGKLFDDCLRVARRWVVAYGTVQERSQQRLARLASARR